MKYLAIFAILFVVSVAAQLPTRENDADKEPVQTYNSGLCYKMAMKNLLLATNVDDPQQEAYLKAADAYLQLDANGQVCQ